MDIQEKKPNFLDMSKWGGDFTREEAQCCLNAGIKGVGLAVGPGGYSQNFKIQADDAGAVGLILETYTFYEWGGEPEWWIQRAYESNLLFLDSTKRFWIDIEDTSQTPPANWREIVERLFVAADAYYDCPVEIYLPEWYATGHLGMKTRQEKLYWNGRYRKQWNSFYDGDTDIDYPYPADVAIEQYQGTTDFCGQSVDLNWCPEYEMAVIEVPTQAQWNALMLRLFAGSEQRDKTDAEKLEYAEYQLSLANSAQSVLDVTLSNMTLMSQALASNPNVSDNDKEEVAVALEKAVAELRGSKSAG